MDANRLARLVGVAALFWSFGMPAAYARAEEVEQGSARIRTHPLVLVRTGVSREVRSLTRPAAAAAPAPRPVSRTRATQRPAGSMPAPSVSFEGIGNVDNHAPADTNIGVGPTAIGQIMRDSFRITDRSGNPLTEIMPGRMLWNGFEGSTCRPDGGASIAGEPVVIYDQLAGRWVWSAWALTGEHHQCFAISVTGDPLGAYYLYDFLYEFSAYGSLPRFGMWPDAYLMTARDTGDPTSPTVVAFDRNAMLAGLPATTIGVSLENSDLFGLLPATLDGLTAPPQVSGSTAPNVLMALGHPDRDGSPTPRIHVYRFHPDFSDPATSTFTGPQDIEVDSFDPAADGEADIVVPQVPPGATLEAFGNPEYRLVYRNFGDHDSIVLEHNVFAGGTRLGPRWYEIRDPLGAPFVHQQGTWAPDDGVWRWMASAAMDKDNNIAIGYSVSNDTDTYPGIRYAGRLANDPPGELSQGEAELIAGEHVFVNPMEPEADATIWGFYNSMVIDPVDDCTFWYTNMYVPASTGGDYSTRIGSFKFDSCAAAPTGTIEGTVTHGDNPLANVRVTAGAATRYTDDAGHYAFSLPAGSYNMTAWAYGFNRETVSGVLVSDGGNTVHDFLLSRAPMTLVEGRVKDGSGGNWPLYSRIEVSASGAPTLTTFSDPTTGYFRIALDRGLIYTFRAAAVLPGYEPAQVLLPLPDSAPSGVVQDFALIADQAACRAPGYTLSTSGFAESFDAGVLPEGWSITQESDGAIWEIFSGQQPCGNLGHGFAGNLTGGDGAFAVPILCAYNTSDSSLTTPSVDLSGFPTAVLRFNSDFPCCYDPAAGDADISTDGGSTWSNVLHLDSNARGPRVEQIDISSLAAGQPDVRARFHFQTSSLLWWQVDNVVIGQASCALGAGGLVVGNVRDANTGAGLNGATVQNLPNGLSTTAFATPDDPGQDDGLYILFAGGGNQLFQASFDSYAPLIQNTSVIPNGAVRLDFNLAAGRLDASPRPLSAKVDPGGSAVQTLDMTNTGTAAAGFQIHEIPPGGALLNIFPVDLAFPYGILFNTDANDFWLSNLGIDFPGDNTNYRFRTNGTPTGDTIDVSSIGLTPMDGAYNPNTGMLWQVFGIYDVGCVYELDPTSKALTGSSICPAFALQQDALAYDPATDTFYSGSLDDGVINHFDSSGTILDSAEVVPNISGLAFNPATGHLFALHQDLGQMSGPDVFVVDPANGYAVVASFFVGDPGTWGGGARGMEMDCRGRLWLVDAPDASYVLEVGSGEAGTCDGSIPWLSEAPTSGTVPGGSTFPVTITFDSAGLFPGLRQAQLHVTTDTPYPLDPVPVDLTVRFLDVPDGSFAENYIYGAAGANIMHGCAFYEFCPAGLVTRADMAGYIWRAVHGTFTPPPAYTGIFGDVFFGDYNASYIQGLYDDGITAGCQGPGEPLKFCPTLPIPREQMAVFVEKGVRGADFVPPACTPPGYFVDVPCPGMFTDWVEMLFADGITAGCNAPGEPPAYCPGQQIPNDQMAVFLVKAYHLPVLP